MADSIREQLFVLLQSGQFEHLVFAVLTQLQSADGTLDGALVGAFVGALDGALDGASVDATPSKVQAPCAFAQ